MRSTHNLLLKLNCKYPIVGAPMAYAAGGNLAAAVTKAGGLGFIGTGYIKKDILQKEIQLAKAALDKHPNNPSSLNKDKVNSESMLPIGIGFVTFMLDKEPELLDVAIEAKPLAYWFSFGDYSPYIARIRAKQPQATIMIQVGNVQDAVKASQDGADVVIAQGLEAGGHGSKEGTSTFCLVPSVISAFEKYNCSSWVLAAGGVTNWRHLAASFNLGSHGVVVGTRLLASNEVLLPLEAKEKIINAGEESTIKTNRIDELKNELWDFTKYSGRALKSPITVDYNYEITPEQYQKAAKDNNFEVKGIYAGMGVNLITQVQSTDEIINDFISGYQVNCVQKNQNELWIPSLANV